MGRAATRHVRIHTIRSPFDESGIHIGNPSPPSGDRSIGAVPHHRDARGYSQGLLAIPHSVGMLIPNNVVLFNVRFVFENLLQLEF